jgi:hypothetical protein
MSLDTSQDNAAPLMEPENIGNEGGVPPGIARLREEWKAAGFSGEPETHEDPDAGGVVFPETDGGAGVGDYSLEYAEVKSMLALSDDAMRRLVLTIGLDSIRVKSEDGTIRRLFSRSSVRRFQEDTAIDTNALESAAKAMVKSSMTEAVDDLRSEVAELRGTQGKILQQMKDILLLEVRNLKEQERDLASFVYELAEELRSKKGK